ncbi:MAG: hypothetical protein PHV06_06800 [bacterium]|nr:hypothetical protein [bacterium]
MELQKDIDRGVLVIKSLVDAFNEKRLFTCSHFPEDVFPENMEVGSNEHLVYISMISSIAYLRKEEQLWCLTRDAYEDSEGHIIFEPEKVLSTSLEDLERTMRQFGLLLSAMVIRQWMLRNPKTANRRELESHDLEIWTNMAQALMEFDCDIEKLLKHYDFDALKIIDDFARGKYSNCFPEYHRERKVILWLVRLQRYGKHFIKNLDKVPMPIGMHIIRATFMTGSVWGNANSIMTDLHKFLSDYWYDVAKKGQYLFKLAPIEFQIHLWILSKYGCAVGRREKQTCSSQQECPLKEFCTEGTFEILGTYVKVDTKRER